MSTTTARRDECDERYRREVLTAVEACACDGNPMPVGHVVYRDLGRAWATSAEHCEVVGEEPDETRVEVDEHGNAFVEAAGRILGIWYRGPQGDLVDNHVDGSVPWTRQLAAEALEGREPSAAAADQEDEPEGNPDCWECQEVRPDYRCLACGNVLCFGCTDLHLEVHQTLEERAYNAEFEARERRARHPVRRVLRWAWGLPLVGVIVALALWGPQPWGRLVVGVLVVALVGAGVDLAWGRVLEIGFLARVDRRVEAMAKEAATGPDVHPGMEEAGHGR